MENIQKLPLISKEEYNRIVFEWNHTTEPFIVNKTIHRIFEEQVEKYPKRTAVIFEDKRLTYYELNEKSNQVAHMIRELYQKIYNEEMKPDTLIGLCVDRNIEMVIGILGILKSGGAYVSLDPRYPEKRLIFMAEDAQCKIILTEQTFLEKLLFMTEGDFGIISLDSGWSVVSKRSKENPVNINKPHDLAYVIYTSGSTGKPKGALLQHSNVIRLFSATKDLYDFSENDIWTCFHSYAFDFSVWEIWGPLLNGGTLVVVPYFTTRDPEEFYELLNKEKVTVLNQTPSAFYNLIEVDSRPGCRIKSLRYIIFGGEALDINKLKVWWDKYDYLSPRLVNMYGITETTVHSTYLPLSPGSLEEKHAYSPIGKRLSDLTFYVLNNEFQPVPVGSPGELYMGGDGLARGYFNRPELTKERFITNPFASDEDRAKDYNTRLYKTGDLVRWLPDSSLEYMGRTDFQVKIRGFRIELGEIETLLGNHPSVSHCIVLAKEFEDQLSLIAYYSLKKGEKSLNRGELRNYLEKELAEYMVPAVFIEMDTMPLTENGKIDRKALPEPSQRDFVSDEDYMPPRNETEKILYAIFCSVLKLEKVGIYDNFFKVGGHSLSATKVISRARDIFRVDLPLSSIFTHPTIEKLADFILLQKEINLEEIEKLEPGQKIPLSFAQQRLWFLDQYEGGRNANYNIPMAFRLKGKLNIPALEKTLNYLITRHESMRTIFDKVDGEAVQIILKPFTVDLTPEPVEIHKILAGLLSDDEIKEMSKNTDTEKLLESFLTEEALCPFDLRKGPVFRAILFEVGENDYALMINQHHIITDGWSIWILLRELGEVYNSYVSGNEPSLAPLNITYGDFSSWQRKHLQGKYLNDQVSYWQEKLKNFEELDLPADYIRPKIKTYNGNIYRFSLGEDIHHRMKKLVLKTNTTFFMVLLSGINLLFKCYSGKNDIIIGFPIAGRTRKDLENITGFFVNTLPFRTDLSGNPEFTGFLERIKKTCIDAYEHQDVPFEHLVDILQVQRDPSRTPVFQVAFALQNTSEDKIKEANVKVFNNYIKLDLQGLDVKDAPFRYKVAKFDLMFNFDDTRDLNCDIEYNTDLYCEDTIKRMAEHLKNLFEGILNNPSEKIENIPLLGKEEREKILVDWNATDNPYPDNKTIQQIFEEEVEKYPDHTAVIFEDSSLTYRELNKKANQLAWLLKDMVTEKNSLIGLCAERSIKAVIDMIAILKAGGAYVPLDINYPEERLKFMLSDTGIKVILTETNNLQKLPFLEEDGRKVICIDRDCEAIEKYPHNNPPLVNNNMDLAVVLYTSGSTGLPKGVMIEHRPLVRLTKGQSYLPIKHSDCIGHVASLCFDAASQEIWSALLNGATLSIMSKETLLTPEKLKKSLSVNRVTIQFFTTAVFHMLVDKYSDMLLSIGTVMFAGEEANAEKVRFFLSKRNNDMKLLNVYGPTEGAVCSSYFLITDDCKKNHIIPIGKPIGGKKLYVLDKYLNPLPIGVPGELYIGGEHIARGYFNRPELTDEKFIKNPFATGKLYKSGDLARWLSDGNLEFLGRTDFQIKIRGYRIELGEIEDTLLKYKEIKECTVQVQKIDGQKIISAYYVSDKPLDNEVLTMYIKSYLPDYMVPSVFIYLEKIPLNPNGKIDRKALPVPELKSVNKYIPPYTKEEKILARIWSDILNIEKIGICDNFFSLGGHSLSATKLIFRIEEEFGIECPLKAIFQYPDIAGLALYISKEMSVKELSEENIQPVSRNIPLPLSYVQDRLWFLDQYEGSNNATYNMPLAYRIRGKVNVKAIESAINSLIERHESFRTTFKNESGKAIEVINPPYTIKLDILPVENIVTVLSKESIKPFDLAKGPLFRVTLYKIKEDDYVLMMIWHHIISDGWSINILIKEFNMLYRSYITKTRIKLPELRLQYADFAFWQKNYFKGEILEKQLKYWSDKLDNFTNLDLPTDFKRPPEKTFKGRHYSYLIDKKLTDCLKLLGRKNHSTLFMILLTAFNILLKRYSQQEDIIIGTPIANRNHRDIQNITGFFVNTLALRNDLSGNPSFLDLLERVNKTCLEAYENQDFPFEQIVDALMVKRDPGRTPIFQVFFSLQNSDDIEKLSLINLTVEQVNVDYDIAKFDLTFSFTDTDMGLKGEIEYNTDLYRPDTIQKMSGHFETLLKSIILNSDESINKVPILTEKEISQIQEEWNIIKVPYREDKTLHELFLEEVKKNPNRIAIAFKEKTLTYSELNRKSNQLANCIREKYKVRNDTLIGLFMDRGIEMIAGIMGILKSGGAYVPVDTSYPEERIQYMLNDSNIEIIITEKGLLNSIPVSEKDRIIIPIEDIEQFSDGEPENINRPNDLAYVIYTSGSTGKPKGVMIEHRSVVNLAEAKIKELPEDDSIRITQFVTISFDVAAGEIYMALLSGSTLYIVPEEYRQDTEGLINFIINNNISVATLPAAVLTAMSKIPVPSLKVLIIGGSVCESETIEFWSKERKLINEYGPTENTIVSTFSIYEKGKSPDCIGKAIQNVRVYVLDEYLNPLPAGIPGELFLGGSGISRGYLNRPELTEEKFIKNPFGSDILYKTGDIVSILSDGSLKFIGRTDFQVKIRGFRVEPEEIEKLLNNHPAIKQSIVIARKYESQNHLIAYYVLNDNKTAINKELIDYLSKELPDYMVPSFFIKLDFLPLTKNGKIDRKALPDPERNYTREDYLPPGTETEKILASIWEDILKIKKAGINSNFFTLGGHSLLVAQVIYRINREFNLNIPVKQMFSMPTIKEMAEYIETLIWSSDKKQDDEGIYEEGEI